MTTIDTAAGADADAVDPIEALLADYPVSRRLPERDLEVGEMRLAARITRRWGEDLRYVHGLGGWHRWDGDHLVLCERAEQLEAAKRIIDDMREDAIAYRAEAKRAEEQGRPDDGAAVYARLLGVDIGRLSSARSLTGGLTLASSSPELALSHRDVDTDPWELNTPSGLVDLRTGAVTPRVQGTLTPHTKVTRGRPGRGGWQGGEWDRFLQQVIDSPQERAFLQRSFGLSLVGQVIDQHLLILTGAGANGKGVLRTAIMHALGDYSTEVSPDLLLRSGQGRHGTFLMRLHGARTVFTSETDVAAEIDAAAMKRLTGGDPLEANFMRCDPICWDPTHSLIMATNYLPNVGAADPAVWRRMHVVQFRHVFSEGDPVRPIDPGLAERLRGCADEVLAWLLDGLADYLRRGHLDPPASVRASIDEYRAESDIWQLFVDDQVDVDDDAEGERTSSADLHRAYVWWLQQRGVRGSDLPSLTAWGRDMAKRPEWAQRRGRDRTGSFFARVRVRSAGGVRVG